jgi:hypothetical protein
MNAQEEHRPFAIALIAVAEAALGSSAAASRSPFIRTRTGALVSRLNKRRHRRPARLQQHPLTLSWQITLLALVLLPVFVTG